MHTFIYANCLWELMEGDASLKSDEWMENWFTKNGYPWDYLAIWETPKERFPTMTFCYRTVEQAQEGRDPGARYALYRKLL